MVSCCLRWISTTLLTLGTSSTVWTMELSGVSWHCLVKTERGQLLPRRARIEFFLAQTALFAEQSQQGVEISNSFEIARVARINSLQTTSTGAFDHGQYARVK